MCYIRSFRRLHTSIVDETTGDLYGHFVAGDPMIGLEYTIPTYAITDDVRSDLELDPYFHLRLQHWTRHYGFGQV